MDEELKKYIEELANIENAIGKVNGVIQVKEENVAELNAQLEDLENKRLQIEKAIEEKEKEQENQKESEDNKVDEISEEEIEVDAKNIEDYEDETFETPLPSGLRIDNLGNKDLMATVAGANKARNNKILSDIAQDINERKSIMPEREMEEKVVETKSVEQKSINDDEMEK